jgi:dipeptidyl aminopeptidase/acylaminoacyl peptidase
MVRRWKLPVVAIVVVLAVAFLGVKLMGARGVFVPARPVSEVGGSAVVVGADRRRIEGRVFVTGTPSANAPLIVVLHGDAPGNKPRYQYFVAAELAAKAPGSRAVALLRPGYADPYGAKSDGDRGLAIGETYTAEVVDQVAAAIESLKAQWSASTVILVGHSGGAAVAANIAALHPGLVRHVFLVACPCDVPAFRQHMAELQSNFFWRLPVHSLSPLVTVLRMDSRTIVTAISGTEDPLTLPQYAQAYVGAAKARGIAASFLTLPGAGHEILDQNAVIENVVAAVSEDSASGGTAR